MDERELADRLLGEPITLDKCEIVDMEVPSSLR